MKFSKGTDFQDHEEIQASRFCGVAAAVVGAAVVGAAATTAASNKATKSQTNAVNSANAVSQDQYNQTREDQAPYRALASEVGLPGIRNFLSTNNSQLTPAQVIADPGYQFGMDQGNRNLQGSAAARGGLYSGATLKALNRFGNDYATTKFDNAFNRMETSRTNQFNRFATAAGIGQTANNQVAQAGQNYANNVGSNLIGAGNAQAAGTLASGNAWGNALNQGVSSYNQYQNANPYASMGFNGSNGAGFTNSQPWTVGPQQG